MNSFKSTEKSINLLKGPLKLRNSRAIQTTKTFDLYLTKSQKNGVIKAPGGSSIFQRKASFRVPRIKLRNVMQTRPLSTQNKITEIPLLNPNKMSPEDAKNVVAPPIIPLTQPRFSKTAGPTVPSVTRILQATMPAANQFILDRWRESMIKKLGVAGFSKWQADTFERGRALHALLAKKLLKQGDQEVELSVEIVSNLWKSIQNVIEQKISNVRLVEHIVTHSDMNYRGIIDCVAFYENELVVIDFKTAEKPKKTVESLYDNPLQVTAYCGALNNDTSIPEHVIDRNISSGLVIVAYSDGSEASCYYLNSQKVAEEYWKKWTNRLDQYTRMEEMKQEPEKSSKNVAK